MIYCCEYKFSDGASTKIAKIKWDAHTIKLKLYFERTLNDEIFESVSNDKIFERIILSLLALQIARFHETSRSEKNEELAT